MMTPQPRTVDSLDILPEDERDWYEPAPQGGFHLLPELLELEEAHEAKLAELGAEIARKEAAIRAATVSNAVYEALRLAGVRHPKTKVAAAYLESRLEFEVREEGEDWTAYVMTPLGAVSVESAVATWLDSDDAEFYRPPKPKAPGDGLFAGMARGLRSLH